MVWLGDNVYLRESDWNSRSGIFKRYSHTRAFPQLQPLLASTSHYAIWDDHDFGPNNSNRSFWGRNNALDAHRLFWPNPSYGVGGKPGITTTFERLDVQFFLLDDRYYRVPEKTVGGEQSILGDHQVQWLFDALSSSTATFKIIAVGSQFLSTDSTKESFIHVPAERQRIIDYITNNKISGVLFITGDVHGAELSKLDRPGTYPLYEFTSSSLTAGSNKNIAKQPNTLRVDGTAYGDHNYGLITVSGKQRQRTITLHLHNEKGERVWQRTLSELDLR
jgi:alkaline phosphatase D